MNIRVLKTVEGAALVEYEQAGQLCRGIAPATLVEGNTINDNLLSLVIPYGVPWEEIIKGRLNQATPDRVADGLRRAGIWTEKDLLSNPSLALGVLQAIYGLDLSTLITLARQYLQEVNHVQ